MENLEIIAPGEHVEIDGGIHARVIAIMIEDGPRVSYKVIWPNGNTLSEQWVSGFMIQKREPQKVTLGFAK